MAQITLNSTGVASSGALVLQSNGTTTAVTVSTGQVATFANDAVVNGLTVGRGAGAVSTNTAVGASALSTNSTGTNNVAVGYQAGYSNTSGIRNLFLGTISGYANTTGSYNTFVGTQGSTANGCGEAITTGSKNTILGSYSGNQGGLDIRTASNYIVLSDGDGNPRGIFDSSGNLLVGTTSVSTITAESTAKAQVAGNFVVGNAVASTNVTATINGVVNKAGRIAFAETGAIKWLIGNGAASENGVFQVYDNVNGTGVQLARSGTSWTSISDEREKDIIESISNAANKVATLRAVIGKYKTDETGTRRSFLIAQDVQAVLPEAIDDTNPNKLGIRYTEIIPLLVAAIQEQQALIVSLKARLDAANL